MSQDIRVVPIEESIARIGPDESIHTFMDTPFGLIGADHDRESLIESMRLHGVEESGSAASRMGHTLVIVRYPVIGGRTTPLFIAALPRPSEADPPPSSAPPEAR